MQLTVVGSGICGVTTALALQSAYPTLRVTIIADKFGEDTTSHGAAGIFRPGGGLRHPNVEEWLNYSYNYYNGILRSAEAAAAGVFRVDGYLYSNVDEASVRNKFLEKILPCYRAASEEERTELTAKAFKYGAYFQTLVVECASFLPWGMRKFKENGGEVDKGRIGSFSELSSGWGINCTGLGARALCGDDRVVGIRGQVFKVAAPWVKMFFYGEYDTYIIPGSSTVTLGGSRHFDSYSTTPDPWDGQSILSRCCDLLPNLKGARIVGEWVGVRPYRDEVRVELESYGDKKIIHNYGHGGYGITSAPGSAMEALKVFHDNWRKSGL